MHFLSLRLKFTIKFSCSRYYFSEYIIGMWISVRLQLPIIEEKVCLSLIIPTLLGLYKVIALFTVFNGCSTQAHTYALIRLSQLYYNVRIVSFLATVIHFYVANQNDE